MRSLGVRPFVGWRSSRWSALVSAGAAAPPAKPRNIVFILTDDHRYDAIGFMGHPLARTPNLDALAKGGAHIRNAFVTTALCSPTRASILTGLYAHTHRVVDNNTPIPPGLPTFRSSCRQAGYETAFIGKWHMGDDDDAPQPGFDHWVSFRGQGEYLPRAGATMLNVDGKHVPQKGYITDELTDYAVDWLGKTSRDKPFFLYLSHKAVHADFVPAERHKGSLKDVPVPAPPTMAPDAAAAARPMWVRNQRNSWHGVDFPYHSTLDVAEYYRRYIETLLAVDDSVGRVSSSSKDRAARVHAGHLHGRQRLRVRRARPDRQAHRLRGVDARADARVRARTRPAGPADRPRRRQHRHRARRCSTGRRRGARAHAGHEHAAAAARASAPWRDTLLYEYYWERNFPQTPTSSRCAASATSTSSPRRLGHRRVLRSAGRPAGSRAT